MSGAGFILAINLFVAALLSAAFMMIAVYDRSRAAARWLAFGYAIGMGFFAIEAVIPSLDNARVAVVAAVACLLAGMAAFNAGVARKYGVRIPWRLIGIVFVASLVVRLSDPGSAAAILYATDALSGAVRHYAGDQRRAHLEGRVA